VKCDKAKPVYLYCINAKVKCNGYQDPKVKSNKKALVTKILTLEDWFETAVLLNKQVDVGLVFRDERE